MSRFYSEDQEYTNEFLKIVEAHGGENCKHWTKVARVYFESTGIQVNQTYKLRKRWETLTNYKENLNEEQTQILYETGIKSRGNNRGGLQSFQQKTGIKMYLGRYTRTISTWLRAAIKMFQEMYIHDKKTRYRRLDEDNYRLSYVSIHIMLRAVDVETKDPIFQELKNCAIKLEELLFLHAKIHNNMGIEKYSVYKDLISRWEFRRIMFYLDYVNELKQISISYYERLEILAHPLLKPTIELNRQCEIYQRIILESDWRSKYELYNQCSALEGDQEYSMLIKKANKKKNEKNPILYDVVSKTAHKICNKAAHAQITQSERQKLRTFRGHYVRPGQIKSRGWTTILFDHDMSSSQIEDDQDNVEDKEQYVQKMQKLFECTFGKESKKNKKLSKNKFYLRPPLSEVHQIKHDPFYVKHGEGKHHVRKIFYLQEYDDYENQKIQELQESIHKHSLQLPAEQVIRIFSWNRELTLKYCYSGGFEISKCIQRLQKHLEWMQDPSCQVLTQEAEHYLKSGYIYQFGRDKELRPVVYIQLHMISKMKLHVPTLLNAATAVGNVVTRYMYVKGYVENWIVILDSGGSGLFDFPFSTLSMINEFFSINFTSSLHKMFILNPSFIFNSSWKLIEKIIHPETAAKINFLKQTDFFKLQEIIPPEDIEVKYGGTHPNLTQFWPPINTRSQPNDEFQRIPTLSKRAMSISEYYSIDNNSKEFYNNSKMKGIVVNIVEYRIHEQFQELDQQNAQCCTCNIM